MADIQTQLPVKGALTNNNAAPSTNNIGALVAESTAAAPTYTEGNEVLLSVDLSGNLRVSATFPGGTLPVEGTLTNNNAPPSTNNIGSLVAEANAAPPTWIEGNEVLLSVDLSGNLRTSGTVTGTLTNNANPPSTNNVGALVAEANAAAPTWIEGNEVLLSVDLGGQLRVKGPVTGTLTNNANPPSTNNVGALTAIANAAAPTWIEGNEVLLSVDLGGQMRVKGPVTGTLTNNANPPSTNNVGALTALANAAAPTWIEGNEVLLSVDLSGNLRTTGTVTGTLTNNANPPTSNNVGVLPALASTAAPSYTSGDQVLLSTDTSGNLRTTATITGTPNVNIADFGGSPVTLGQNTEANSIPVTIASDQTVPIVASGEVSTGIVTSYQTASAVANGSTGTLTYTVTAGKTLYLKQIIASASGGPCRVQVDYGAGPTIICVGFTSTADPNYVVSFAQPISIAAATAVHIKIMNNAGAAQDVYGTFIGHEI